MNRMENLESRVLLAGNVEAVLSDEGVLTLTGDVDANSIVVSERLERVAGLARVSGGTTSLTFDATALEAAGLKISSFRSPIRGPRPTTTDPTVPPPVPTSGKFPILRNSDLVYATDTQIPQGGAIKQAGGFGFNADSLMMTNFQVGYDASRILAITVIGGPSGYYIYTVDSAGAKTIYFDISSPEVAPTSTPATAALRLTVSGNLLVSPELAAKLELPDAAGDDVGDAKVLALASPVMKPAVVVTGLPTVVPPTTTPTTTRNAPRPRPQLAATTINTDQKQVSFPAVSVKSIVMDLGEGDDRAAFTGLRLEGDLGLATGAGKDAVIVAFVSVKGAFKAELGAGNDLLSLTRVNVTGKATLDGGEDTDRLVVLGSTFGEKEVLNFESQFPPTTPPPPPPPPPAGAARV